MLEKLSAEDVVSSYVSGERNFSWKDLSGLDLHSADLRDANLFGTNLSGANLTGVNLDGVNLAVASLCGCLLKNVDLRHVFLAGSNLTDADLTGSLLPEPSPTSAEPQLPSPNAAAARLAYARVGPEKSPGLAGFLEYIYPGVGLLYCDAIKPGLWFLIGTTVASVVVGALFIASFILGIMITGAKTEDEARLFPGIFLSIITPLSLIWLIVRIVWAARAARAYNERRLGTLRELRAQFRSSMGAQQTAR